MRTPLTRDALSCPTASVCHMQCFLAVENNFLVGGIQVTHCPNTTPSSVRKVNEKHHPLPPRPSPIQLQTQAVLSYDLHYQADGHAPEDIPLTPLCLSSSRGSQSSVAMASPETSQQIDAASDYNWISPHQIAVQ